MDMYGTSIRERASFTLSEVTVMVIAYATTSFIWVAISGSTPVGLQFSSSEQSEQSQLVLHLSLIKSVHCPLSQ